MKEGPAEDLHPLCRAASAAGGGNLGVKEQDSTSQAVITANGTICDCSGSSVEALEFLVRQQGAAQAQNMWNR